MRTLTRCGCLVLGLLLLAACQKPVTPELKTTDLQGHTIDFADYRGKWIVLNYWASWCEPCRDEIPALNAFAKAHSKDVVVLGVSYDPLSKQEQLAIIKKLHIQYPVLAEDPTAKLKLGQIAGLPTSFLIDRTGHLQRTLYGQQTKQSLEKAMRLN